MTALHPEADVRVLSDFSSASDLNQTPVSFATNQHVNIVGPNSIPDGGTVKMEVDALRWVKLGSKAGPELPVFRVRFDTIRHPTSSAEFQHLVTVFSACNARAHSRSAPAVRWRPGASRRTAPSVRPWQPSAHLPQHTASRHRLFDAVAGRQRPIIEAGALKLVYTEVGELARIALRPIQQRIALRWSGVWQGRSTFS